MLLCILHCKKGNRSLIWWEHFLWIRILKSKSKLPNFVLFRTSHCLSHTVLDVLLIGIVKNSRCLVLSAWLLWGLQFHLQYQYAHAIVYLPGPPVLALFLFATPLTKWVSQAAVRPGRAAHRPPCLDFNQSQRLKTLDRKKSKTQSMLGWWLVSDWWNSYPLGLGLPLLVVGSWRW